MITNQEKNTVISDYKAEQHVRIAERIREARAAQEERERKAASDPDAKAALKEAYERKLEYHRRQVADYEQKLASLA